MTGMEALPEGIRKILVRSTNWIGDAVMTTPAVRTIRENFPEAKITLLALPWVADVFSASPRVDRIHTYDRNGRHKGLRGKIRLAGELREERFEAAILLQNAFEAAFITALARIPVRAGYTTDGRGLLLTHGVRRPSGIKARHQVHYYQEMLRGLGLTPGPDELELPLADEDVLWAASELQQYTAGIKVPVVGLNPGAAYGPAKRWPAEKFADLAARLCRETESLVLVFGTEADRGAADLISEQVNNRLRVVDLTGRTSLGQALAMISLCSVFVTNDSGLMHVAAALRVPTVAIFGSTDHVATGPFSDRASIVRVDLECSPCLETHCPKKHFRCMEEISVKAVADRVLERLEEQKG
ncbi:MAG: lipopolysaccharide heptosyltransferase II [Desulfobulbaceae bacterium]